MTIWKKNQFSLGLVTEPTRADLISPRSGETRVSVDAQVDPFLVVTEVGLDPPVRTKTGYHNLLGHFGATSINLQLY